jgi:hypothetical protein
MSGSERVSHLFCIVMPKDGKKVSISRKNSSKA